MMEHIAAVSLHDNLGLLCPRIAQRGCCRAHPELMSESRSEPDALLVRDGRNSRKESQKGRREKELRNSQEKRRTRLHSEKQACPRRRNPTAIKTVLSRSPAERDGQAFWDAEQSNCHPPSREGTRIASQPFCPRKSRVCALGTRKGRRCDSETGGGGRPDLDLDALMAHQLDARPSVVPTTPVTPEHGFRPNHQWMQQHTHLARLLGCAALPLTLLAQGTGTATTDTGRIDHAQAPIGFSALLMGTKLLASGTAQRPIWLERKVLTREAARFPG